MSEKERSGDDANFGKFDLDGPPPSYEHQNDINSRLVIPPLLPPHYLQPNVDGAISTHYPTMYYHPQQEQITGGQRTDQVVFLPGSSPPSQRSFLWPMLISCFTFWCCGFFLGSLAFLIAMIGQDAASRGNDIRASLFQKFSFGVSLAGIIIGLVFIVVLGSMFGHYAANRISCPHGYYHHNGQRVCCGSVTCTHGVHIDSDTGCLQCCDPYSKLDCFKYGYVNDSQGCKVCCSLTKESCTYGSFYNDSLGCLKCCEPLRYSNFGYYTDSNGCKQSCPMYDYSSCTGYRLDHRGCKVCCDPRDPTNSCCENIGACIYAKYNDSNGCLKCCERPPSCLSGYFLDSRGCTKCCDPSKSDTGCNCSNIRCHEYGWYFNASMGCKACCRPGGHCLAGTYYDAIGCAKCCQMIRSCPYGYFVDSKGCKKCCPPIYPGSSLTSNADPDTSNIVRDCNCSNVQCLQGRIANHTCDAGGPMCCESADDYQCQLFGYYFDASGCKKCCTGHLSPPGYFCTNGFTRQNGTCGQCCKSLSDPVDTCSNS